MLFYNEPSPPNDVYGHSIILFSIIPSELKKRDPYRGVPHWMTCFLATYQRPPVIID